jgi:cation transport ATPase
MLIGMPPAPLETLDIPVEGMSCQACAITIEKALRAVPGWSSAGRYARLRSCAARAGNAADRKRWRRQYRVRSSTRSSLRGTCAWRTGRPRALSRSRRDVIAIAPHPVVLAHPLGLEHQLALLFSIPVQFIAGWNILSAGLRAALRLAPDMNTLVAMGSLAAWGSAATETLAPGLPGPKHLTRCLILPGARPLAGSRVRRARATRSASAGWCARVSSARQTDRGAAQEVRPGNISSCGQ